MPRQSH